MKCRWLWTLLLVISGALSLYAQAPADKRAAPLRIRVVCDDNYPPYVFRSVSGEVQGIIPDQWNAWSAVTGILVQFDAMDWSKAQEEMRSGRADVIDSIFKTPERQLIYDFLDPYAELPVPVYFYKSISGLAQIQDLTGFRIAVKEGDAAVEMLKAQGITDLLYFPSYEAIIRAAQTKDVRIFCIDEPPANYFLYKYQLDQDFKKGFNLYTGQFHRAVLKKRHPLADGRDLYQVVRDGFANIPSSVYAEIERRWLGQDVIKHIHWVPLIVIGGISLGVIALLALFTITLRMEVARRTAELIQKNRALIQSERKTQAFINALPDLFLILDREGRYIDIKTSNPAILIDKPESLLGHTIAETDIPPKLASQMMDAIDRALAGSEVVIIKYDLDVIEGQRYFEARIVRLSVVSGEGDLVLFIVRDITEEHQMQEALALSLREKETLLKEIHHRVKNNLQIVSSLIQLQATSLRDERDQALLEETQQRIRTMAQVHELLYRSDRLSSIEMKEYLERLLDELVSAYYETSRHVDIVLDIDPMDVSIAMATPLGLIFNEAVTNAFKYAYTDRDHGRLRVSLKRLDNGNRRFMIADDGPGLPEHWQERAKTSLGFTLIQTLVQQIKGNLEIQAGPGAVIAIKF